MGPRHRLGWALHLWGLQGTCKALTLGPSTLPARTSVDSSRGTPQIRSPLWPPQERGGPARRVFQPTKTAEISPNQTRMLGLEGAQKPFVLWFPVVSFNFYCLRPFFTVVLEMAHFSISGVQSSPLVWGDVFQDPQWMLRPWTVTSLTWTVCSWACVPMTMLNL